jgi:hypothetical protein
VGGGEAFHRRPEGIAQLGADRRGGDRVAQVLGQEADHLPADLEVRHIGVQVDPIQALKVEGHMAVEHVVDVAHRHHMAPQHEDRLRPTMRVMAVIFPHHPTTTRRSEAGLTGSLLSNSWWLGL